MLNIFEEQNSEKNLMLNYSQRVHYNRAEKLNFINWIVVIFTLILNLFTPTTQNLIILHSITILILTLLEVYLDISVSTSVAIGAATKDLFDRTLFKLPIGSKLGNYSPRELYDIAITTCSNHNNKLDYNTQISNTGNDTPPGLKDWYTNKQSKNDNYCILNCQSENIYWCDKLSKKLLKIIIIIATIFFCITVLFITLVDVPPYLVLIKIIPFIGLAFKSNEVINITTYNKAYSECNTLINALTTTEVPPIEMLINLQEHIFTLRSSKHLIPNTLHKVQSETIHQMWAKLK